MRWNLKFEVNHNIRTNFDFKVRMIFRSKFQIRGQFYLDSNFLLWWPVSHEAEFWGQIDLRSYYMKMIWKFGIFYDNWPSNLQFFTSNCSIYQFSYKMSLFFWTCSEKITLGRIKTLIAPSFTDISSKTTAQSLRKKINIMIY